MARIDESDPNGDRRKRRIGAGVGVVIFLAAAVWNLRAASLIADREGMTLGEAFGLWLEGYDATAMYSGRTLLAIDRIETALLILGVLVLWAVWARTLRVAVRRVEQRG